MQLVDSVQIKRLAASFEQVMNTIEDIATQVQIQSNFCISHPDYKPFEIPAETVVRFQRLPLDLQNKYLNLQLRTFLYGIYYNGSLRKNLAIGTDSMGIAPQQNLENNTLLGVDLAFYERLHESNSGEGYFDPGWSVVMQENDGKWAVKKGELTLYIEPERHLQLQDQSAAIGDEVAVRLPRNLVQNGFYMAAGNAGPHGRDKSDSLSKIVRIYFNLSPEGAVAVMSALTRKLNEISLPFMFKALYNPADYDRYDSAVLYFEKRNYEAVRQVLESVYPEERSHFKTEVPLFTKVLAPGLSLAEEPDSKFTSLESFGLNRCQIIANGLLEAWQNGDDSKETRMKTIFHHFSVAGVELEYPHLNAKSEDIYTHLELCK